MNVGHDASRQMSTPARYVDIFWVVTSYIHASYTNTGPHPLEYDNAHMYVCKQVFGNYIAAHSINESMRAVGISRVVQVIPDEIYASSGSR